jgi:hypothetical protein
MNAWAEWPLLKEHPWDWYITCTFPKPTKADRAAKVWNLFLNKLGREVLSARKARSTGLPALRAIELNESGDAHIHALIGDVKDYNRIMDLWEQCSGRGIIDLSRYRKQGNALSYVTKEGEVELSRYFHKV